MTKVIGMLVALAMFCAMPAVALAQDSGGGGNDNVASGNDQENNQDGTANGGDADGDGDGGDAGVQQGSCQQNAGRDANCEINQSQDFEGDTFVDNDGDGVDDDDEVVHGHDDNNGVDNNGVHSVNLARTGFDAWVLALIGGLTLAGGIGLLTAQRRGRLSA